MESSRCPFYVHLFQRRLVIFSMCDNALNIIPFLLQQFHTISQGSRFPGAMRSLKDRMPQRCFRLRLGRFAVEVWVAASLSSFFKFKQLNSLSGPGVEQG